MNCKNCLEYFNLKERLPYSFNCCGETICFICCEKNMDNQKMINQCPQCQKEIIVDIQEISSNQLIKQKLEKQQKQKIFCQQHQNKISFYSEKDKQFGCQLCLFEGSNFTLESVKQLQSQELIEDLNQIYKYYQQLQNAITHNKNIIENLLSEKNIKIDSIYQLQNQFQQLDINIQLKFINLDNDIFLQNLKQNEELKLKVNQLEQDNFQLTKVQTLLKKNLNQLQNDQNKQKEKIQKKQQKYDNKENMDQQELLLKQNQDLKNKLIFNKLNNLSQIQEKNQQIENLNQEMQEIEKQTGYNYFRKCESILMDWNHFRRLRFWIDKNKLQLQLVYRATRDGFTSKSFHQKCDFINETLVLIKSENNQLFGGYADQDWNQNNKHIQGKGYSFLFSLTKNTKHNCIQKQFELYGHQDYLAVFGGGKDLIVFNQANENQNSYCNLGHSYQPPENQIYGNESSRNYLAGSYKFKVLEMEVFKVIQ